MRTIALGFAVILAACNRYQEINAAGGSTVEIEQGARFSITKSTSPTVSPEYQYTWLEPEVTGRAVVYEGPGEGRSRGRPGDGGEKVFLFRAVEAGQADILIRLQAGEKAKGSDYTLRVQVR